MFRSVVCVLFVTSTAAADPVPWTFEAPIDWSFDDAAAPEPGPAPEPDPAPPEPEPTPAPAPKLRTKRDATGVTIVYTARDDVTHTWHVGPNHEVTDALTDALIASVEKPAAPCTYCASCSCAAGTCPGGCPARGPVYNAAPPVVYTPIAFPQAPQYCPNGTCPLPRR